MPEPARRGVRQRGHAASSLKSVFRGYPALMKFVRSRRRFFFYHYAGFGLASTGFVGAAAWYPAHMGREFGWNGSQIGLGLGVAMIVGGIVGKALCGYFVDIFFRRGHKDAQFRWYAGCLIAATPIGLVAVTGASPWVFLGGFTIFQILLSPLAAVYVASLNLVTPNELRGAGVALYGATIGLLALSLGPILIAVFSDYVYGGNAINLGIATMFGSCLPLAAVALIRGRPAMWEAVASAEEWSDENRKLKLEEQ